ncbi:hypothetical protein LPAF129_14390 [Ligilactobacillus pabuli]|uniref:Uncharacterized protein n=1 Tax=Ligilactobacillus pabuli TaxID=2886039 RepID=A0ABQ5JJ26_9LACO|nr:DEAD/DEAH box helicase family protein [Ligilactobacillus pabuli]GKS81753.1 hypothetical protein LPAF129_14390 [Ligilactobacillus pabuli]
MAVELRGYQKQAVNAFQKNHYRGIFDMATGTGKTYTSIACAQEYYADHGKQLLVILVPFIHLITQWKENLLENGIVVDVEVAYGKDKWNAKLSRMIWEYQHGFRKRLVIIGSYRSTGGKKSQFAKILKRAEHDNSFLLADECHYLGSKNSNPALFSNFNARLGLSATPKRWWDEKGTAKIYRLFDKEIFSFSLEEAINQGFLTEYSYHPVPVKLSIDETTRYIKLSEKIGKLMVLKQKNKGSSVDEDLQNLLIKRSRIIEKADAKEAKFLQIFKSQNPDHSLVYCAPGDINKFTYDVALEGVSVSEFKAEVSYPNREKMLQDFSRGKIQTLTAMKCLDEGVDVPATRVAFFLASTTNPRQFIQRRGRILRKSPGKKQAEVYDFIVIPDKNEMDEGMAKSLVKREIPRFHEFAEYANNKYEARELIRPILAEFALDSYLDKSSWDVYQEMMEEENEQFTS